MEELDQQFLLRSGEFIGAFKHIGPEAQNVLKIELTSEEPVKTSDIEGEVLTARACNPLFASNLGSAPSSGECRPPNAASPR